MPEYTHTLIPDRIEFTPEPMQIVAFFRSLTSIGAAPLKPSFAVGKPSGEVRSFTNPFTGKVDSYAEWTGRKVKSISAVAGALKGLGDYIVTVAGKGPPKLAAFEFDFQGVYDFDVRCCRSVDVVSTSDWHDDVPVKRKVEFFGRPCSSKNRIGVFHNPDTLAIIEVANAGCAKFRVEFEFGKMLFPRIVDRLDLIAPSIVACAAEHFGVSFVQGCHWCG